MNKNKISKKKLWIYDFLIMFGSCTTAICIMIFIGLFIFLINYALAIVNLTTEQIKATTYGVIIIFAIFFLISVFTLTFAVSLKIKNNVSDIDIKKVEEINNEKNII